MIRNPKFLAALSFWGISNVATPFQIPWHSSYTIWNSSVRINRVVKSPFLQLTTKPESHKEHRPSDDSGFSIEGKSMEQESSSSSSSQSQLSSAFSDLQERDQYDAVLTSLCAKLLDEPPVDLNATNLEGPLDLVREMNNRNIKASPRSLMALIDATVAIKDPKVMSKVMNLGFQNGGISNFGQLRDDIRTFPANTPRRKERLQSLPDIPPDHKTTEMLSAMILMSVTCLCWAVDMLGLTDLSPFTHLIWTVLLLFAAIDNLYTAIKFLWGVLVANDKGTNVRTLLPENLPLGLGSGRATGIVSRGFRRLFKVGEERECECEAAALFTGYVLGLPIYSFQPNGLEAAVLVAESSQENSSNELESLLNKQGIMKMLIWLLVPVAMEQKYGELLKSDPGEAVDFLQRLENSKLIDQRFLWWVEGGRQERQDLLKWAFHESKQLLRRYESVIDKISVQLASGSATIGDCVSTIEGW